MTRRAITRRHFLRGAGAAVALPWLEAIADGRPPVRTAVVFMPNGVRQDRWTPARPGRRYDLPSILTPLEPVRDRVSVISGLWNRPTHTGDGHYVKTAGFLTGATIRKTTGRDLDARGVSVDQLLAQRVGGATPLPSLELSLEPVTTGIDKNVGYTRLYGSHISWSTPRTPVSREIEPRRAFDRMFRREGPAGSRVSSILDLVAEDAKSLARDVGEADRRRVEEYLESVRSLEQRIARDDGERRAALADPDVALATDGMAARVDAFDGDPAERGRLMLDLIVLAFRADVTHVATFMFGNAVSNRSFAFLDGVSGGHHEVSHHQDDPGRLDEYERIAAWHVEQFARMVAQLDDIVEEDGTLLDHTSLLFGSGLRDGNRHDPKDLPILLAGGGGGYFEPGAHLPAKQGTPLCRLHLDLLAAAGVRVDRFGDADRPLLG